jgi:hypothetical protein
MRTQAGGCAPAAELHTGTELLKVRAAFGADRHRFLAR